MFPNSFPTPWRNHFLFTLVTLPTTGLEHRPFLLQYRAAFHFFSLSLFIFSLTALSPQTESRMCVRLTHTSWTLTTDCIHHLTYMLHHCLLIMLNHMSKHNHPTRFGIFHLFSHHVFFIASFVNVFLHLFSVPLSISWFSLFVCNFLLCSFLGIETWLVTLIWLHVTFSCRGFKVAPFFSPPHLCPLFPLAGSGMSHTWQAQTAPPLQPCTQRWRREARGWGKRENECVYRFSERERREGGKI